MINGVGNCTFHKGYEGEPEIILTLPSSDAIHIWKGYFDDIYDTPLLDRNEWNGFTRDYHQMEVFLPITGCSGG